MYGRSPQRRASFNTDGGDTSGFQSCNNSIATNNSYEDGIDGSIRTAKRTNTTTSSIIRRGLKGIYGTIREENTTSSSNDNSPFRRSGSGGGETQHSQYYHHGDSSSHDQSVETNSTNDDNHHSMLVENHMLIATMPLKGGDNTDVFHSDTTGTTDSSGDSGYELGNGNVYESNTSSSTNSSGYSGYQRGNGNVYESNTSESTNSSGYSGYQRGNGGAYDSNTTPTSYTTSEDNNDSYGSSQYQSSSSDGTPMYDSSNYTSSNNTETTHRSSFSSTSQSSSTSNRRMGNHNNRRASVDSYPYQRGNQSRRASVDSFQSQSTRSSSTAENGRGTIHRNRRASVDSYPSQSTRSSSTTVNGRGIIHQSRRVSVDSSPSQSTRSSSTAVNRRGTDQNNILRSSISSATSSSRRRTVDNSDMSSVTRPSSRDNSSIHTGQTGGTPGGGVDQGKDQCPYQIQFHVQHQGKNIQGSKRVIHIRFGYANNVAISQGLTGVDCRGEEHDIVVFWSITGGKRSISMNGNEIQYEVGKRSNATRRADILEAAWRLGGHVYQLKFYAFKPSAGSPEKRSPKWKQYSLFIDGKSYFDLPQIFDLGGRTGSSPAYPAPSPPTVVRRSNELSNSMISDFSSSQQLPDESNDVKNAIKNRIDLQRKLMKTKQKVTPSESRQRRVAPSKSDNASQVSFMTVSEVSRMSSIDNSATYTPKSNTTTDLEEDGIDDSERTGIMSCAPTELSERTGTISSASQGRPTRRATVDTTISLESFNSMVLSMDDSNRTGIISEQTEIASGSSSRSRRGHGSNHSSHPSSTTESQTTSGWSQPTSSTSSSTAECQALTPSAHQAQTTRRVPRRASSASAYQEGQTTALVPRRASLGGGEEGVNKFGFF